MDWTRRKFLMVGAGISATALAPRFSRTLKPKHIPGTRVKDLTSNSQEAVVVGTMTSVRTMAGNTDARRFLIAWPKTVTISASQNKVWPKTDTQSTRAQADAQDLSPEVVASDKGGHAVFLGDLWDNAWWTWEGRATEFGPFTARAPHRSPRPEG